jgi:hypothetical protein
MASSISWPQPAVAARQSMLNWYQQVLADAQKIDPTAKLETPGGGMGVITMNGQQIPLTNTMKDDQDRFGVTPSQMLNQKIAGGLMNLTAPQNQAVADSLVAAMNQTPATASQAYSGMSPAVNGVPSAPHINVGATEYGVTLDKGKLGLAPQNFVPTVTTPSAETRRVESQDPGGLGTSPFAGYSVSPETGGDSPNIKETSGQPIQRNPGNATGHPATYRMRDLLRRNQRSSPYGKF